MEHRDEYDRIFDGLLSLSRQAWAAYEEYNPLPPITDMLLEYSCAFLDFKNTLEIQADGAVNCTNLYFATAESYDAYIEYLLILKGLKKQISTLV